MQKEYSEYIRNCLDMNQPPLSPKEWIKAGNPTSPLTEIKEKCVELTAPEFLNKNVLDAFNILMQNNKRELDNMRLASLEEKRWQAVDNAVAKLSVK